MRTRARVMVLAACVLAAGCGDDLLAFGSGKADAIALDEAPTGGGVIGSLVADVQVSLSDNGSQWVDLDEPNNLAIPLQGGTSTTLHPERDVSAGAYSRVRLILEDATIQLAAGSIIAGTTLTSATTVAIGGSDQRVEVTVVVPAFAIEVAPAGKRTIVFNLESTAWLTLAAVQAGVVQDAAIQAAVTAQVRQDPPR